MQRPPFPFVGMLLDGPAERATLFGALHVSHDVWPWLDFSPPKLAGSTPRECVLVNCQTASRCTSCGIGWVTVGALRSGTARVMGVWVARGRAPGLVWAVSGVNAVGDYPRRGNGSLRSYSCSILFSIIFSYPSKIVSCLESVRLLI